MTYSETPSLQPGLAPGFGEHTDEILQKELGFSEAELKAMRTAKAVVSGGPTHRAAEDDDDAPKPEQSKL